MDQINYIFLSRPISNERSFLQWFVQTKKQTIHLISSTTEADYPYVFWAYNDSVIERKRRNNEKINKKKYFLCTKNESTDVTYKMTLKLLMEGKFPIVIHQDSFEDCLDLAAKFASNMKNVYKELLDMFSKVIENKFPLISENLINNYDINKSENKNNKENKDSFNERESNDKENNDRNGTNRANKMKLLFENYEKCISCGIALFDKECLLPFMCDFTNTVFQNDLVPLVICTKDDFKRFSNYAIYNMPEIDQFSALYNYAVVTSKTNQQKLATLQELPELTSHFAYDFKHIAIGVNIWSSYLHYNNTKRKIGLVTKLIEKESELYINFHSNIHKLENSAYKQMYTLKKVIEENEDTKDKIISPFISAQLQTFCVIELNCMPWKYAVFRKQLDETTILIYAAEGDFSERDSYIVMNWRDIVCPVKYVLSISKQIIVISDNKFMTNILINRNMEYWQKIQLPSISKNKYVETQKKSIECSKKLASLQTNIETQNKNEDLETNLLFDRKKENEILRKEISYMDDSFGKLNEEPGNLNKLFLNATRTFSNLFGISKEIIEKAAFIIGKNNIYQFLNNIKNISEADSIESAIAMCSFLINDEVPKPPNSNNKFISNLMKNIDTQINGIKKSTDNNLFQSPTLLNGNAASLLVSLYCSNLETMNLPKISEEYEVSFGKIGSVVNELIGVLEMMNEVSIILGLEENAKKISYLIEKMNISLLKSAHLEIQQMFISFIGEMQ